MIRPIVFKGSFGFRQYCDFLQALNSRHGDTNLVIDLSKIQFGYANGIVPLVSSIRSLHEQGITCDVILPEEEYIYSSFDKLGWTSGILGEDPKRDLRAGKFVPLTSYSTHDELNPLISEIIDVLARNTVFEPGVIDAIAWSMNEIADNVLLHAGDSVSGWIQVVDHPKKGFVDIVIVDSGMGISGSLKQAFPDLNDDVSAVLKAIERGVTRDQSVGQGNGLAGTVRIAEASKEAYVNIHSGSGQFRLQHEKTYSQKGPFHQGTLVELTLPTTRALDVADALWGFTPMNEFELRYLQDDGSGILVVIADETSGFGNRASARPVRVKIRNLIAQFPNEAVVLDFQRVNLISASFADELVARLVKEIGPTGFFSRVRLVNLSDFARRTIDAVISQRLGGDT